ncbi:hypothetical protein VNI00_012998 [Paramarasmius palmivorus]|uniref:Uncharacterized protein n=1 Tax=Paramarasmius palmivorus TaxID=297713 RepID=A0AAW0C0F8_9AGAR
MASLYVFSYNDTDTIDNAAQFMLWYFNSVRKEEIKDPLRWLSDCRHLLNDNSELYMILKNAHATQDFTQLDQSDLLHRCRVRWSSQFEQVRNILAGLGTAGTMPLLLNAKPWLAYGFWEPPPPEPDFGYPESREEWKRNPAFIEHIKALEIPMTQVNPTPKLPDLALHDLGRFHENPVLMDRLTSIFNDTSNTSEDSWTTSLPQENYSSALESNIKLAHRRFSEVLLSRLLTLQEFMRNIGSGQEFRRSWLEMQIHQPNERPLERLCAAVQSAGADDRVINDAIGKSLEEIFSQLDLPEGERFYVVLDQAEAASQTWYESAHLGAFRDEKGKDYPILKEILRCWQAHMKSFPVSFVVSGREIPKEYFTSEEWSNYRWTSDTGCFNGGEEQRQYIARYLPPSMTGPAKEDFLDRACKLLPGRFRITARFVAFLLSDIFRPSCDDLLDWYVYTPWQLRSDDPMLHDFDAGDVSYEPKILATINRSLVHALCFGEGINIPSCENSRVVLNGYGRFVDASMSTIAIGEIPIISRAAYKFCNSERCNAYFDNAQLEEHRSLTDIDYFVQRVLPSARNGSQKDHLTTCHIIACLAALFEHGHRMYDVFSFPALTPSWAGQYGKLALRQRAPDDTLRISPFQFTKRTYRKLVTRPSNLCDLAAWIEGRGENTPFCLHSTESGDIIITCIQMQGGGLFWAFIKVVTQFNGEEMPTSDLAQCYESMDPALLFSDCKIDDPDIPSLLKNLLQKCPQIGPYNVLRVVVPFNAKIDINHPEFSRKKGSVALLGTDLLQSYVCAKELNGETMAHNVIFALTGQRESLEPYSEQKLVLSCSDRWWVGWKEGPKAPQPSPPSKAATSRHEKLTAMVATKRKRHSALPGHVEVLDDVGATEDDLARLPFKRLRFRLIRG